MKLQELLKDVAVLSNTADGEAETNEVRYDSRAVQKGDLFVAIRGYATDGHKYIAKALEQGAAAVVCEEAPEGVPAVVVENSRIALAEIAANRFGHPADSMVMLGVTGTNGKTTTTYLVKHMLEDAGHKVGLIGTNQNLIGSEVIETERTTPESYELHALFARMRDAGCTHVIMEVSSHSLVLDRVHGIRFAVGAFTNLTQDHLDFHKTMENYRKAKAILFTVSDKGVINLDDAAAPKMLADAKCPCLTYSCGKPEATLCATALQLHADGVGLMTNYGGVYLGDRRLDELMAELDGRGALAVMHPTQPAVMVPDVNEEIPVPAFEYFVETTRAFLNMAQNDTFTTPNMLAFVVPAGDYEKEAALLTELESRGEIDHAVGLANTEAMDGYMLADKLTPRQFSELAGLDYEMAQVVYAAEQGDYGKLMGNIASYKVPLIDTVRTLAQSYYPDGNVYVAGDSTNEYDFQKSFARDNTVVSIVSILIVLVVLFTFLSAGMPVLLILVIQGSIWINFSIPAVLNQTLFFMSYLVVSLYPDGREYRLCHCCRQPLSGAQKHHVPPRRHDRDAELRLPDGHHLRHDSCRGRNAHRADDLRGRHRRHRSESRPWHDHLNAVRSAADSAARRRTGG